MKSFKRRRAINIDSAYIDALKKASKQRLGVKGRPTSLAAMIFDGREKGLGKIEKVGKTAGVSMTEAVWLSIRHRADSTSNSISGTAQDILSGSVHALSDLEISFGITRAKEREERRKAGNPEESRPGPRLRKKNSSRPPSDTKKADPDTGKKEESDGDFYSGVFSL